MKLLIISATKLEIKPLLKKLNYHKDDWDNFTSLEFEKHQIDVLATGIGLVFTTFHLCKTLNSEKYDLVINTGIAGSFKREIEIGEVVHVVQEEFADLGIEGSSMFKTLFELGFADKNEIPFKDGKLMHRGFDSRYIGGLKKVSGISSNTAHGNQKSINFLKEKFEADIETMEGAAFFYVCLQEEVNFVQIRAISNYVEPRNKEGWDIPLALDNLGGFLVKLINCIN